MSGYSSIPPPDPSPSERRFNRMWFTIGAVIIGAVILSLAGFLTWAFRPPTPEERAKTDPPRRDARGPRPSRSRPTPPASRPTPVPPADPAPSVPPPTEFKPREVPMGAQAAAGRKAAVVPQFTVQDEFGSFTEPETPVLTSIDGKETVTLQHLWEAGKEITVPVTELRMVEPFAKQTKLGKCCGPYALSVGKKQPRNKLFYKPNPRVACAAYTAFILRHCKRPGGSFSASAQYAQLRKRGGRLVASKVSTRYLPYYKFFKSGDFVVFHKGGGRIGHIEIIVGKGLVSGTSSSAGRVAIRRLGNRGFSTCSVLRI